MKKLLHVGCGPQNQWNLHGFPLAEWQETRLDIDARVEPDIIGSMSDMSRLASGAFSGLYSSHNIEHLPITEIPQLFSEFARLLAADGFVVITCPDLQSVCAQVAAGNLEQPLYQSGMGPIAAIDILYGHRPSLAAGNGWMAHRSGFTSASLSAQLLAAGFQTVVAVQRPQSFDLWAMAWKSVIAEDHATQLAQPFFPAEMDVPAPSLQQRQTQWDQQYPQGLQWFQQGQAEQALGFYQQALMHANDPPTRAYLLGYQAMSLNNLGRVAECMDLSRLALALDPSQLAALCAQAYACLLMQDFAACLSVSELGLRYHPDRIELLHNRTAALGQLLRNEEALATSERILELNPMDARALANSATMLTRLGRYHQALPRLYQAAHLNPCEPWILGALLTAKLRAFDWAELDPLLSTIADHIAEGRPAIEPFRYLPACADPQAQLDAANIYVMQRIAKPEQISRFPTPDRQPRRLRIGYFSSDFRTHPVQELMAEVFELHDRSAFECHAYSLLNDPNDPAQIRARAAFEHFHNVEAMPSSAIIALALSHQLDIAIDLNGHTMGARPVVLATRVAPIQIGYLGFPASMGGDWMDYILADQVVIPASHRRFYAEKVLALPHSFQPNDRCRQPPPPPLGRSEYGLPETGFVFCCFNTPIKLQPAQFACWMRILEQVQGSVLWLVSSHDELSHQHLRSQAQAAGIDPQRLVFAPRLDLPEHFARHARADLFLDTFPFNAGATASCALWCELPVLTMSGDTFTSRYGASLLRAVGLPELITTDLASYQQLAIELAGNTAKLAAIKTRLQRAKQDSPLFDTPRFVQHLEAAYQAVWSRHVRGEAPDHLDVAAP